jgi:predicted membrane metal-binding protein
MSHPITPVRPESGNKAFTILRIFLWLMPAIFIPVFAFLAMMAFDPLNSNNANAAMGFGILGIVIASAAVGYFDQRIALMQKKAVPPHSKTELARWTAIFVALQIIIAPTVCYAVVYGFCAVTGNF